MVEAIRDITSEGPVWVFGPCLWVEWGSDRLDSKDWGGQLKSRHNSLTVYFFTTDLSLRVSGNGNTFMVTLKAFIPRSEEGTQVWVTCSNLRP